MNTTVEHAAHAADEHRIVEITLSVPELKRSRPVGGCCALPPEFLIEESLREAEGVSHVVVSDRGVAISAKAVDGGQELIRELTDRIEEVGFSVTATTVSKLGSDRTAASETSEPGP